MSNFNQYFKKTGAKIIVDRFFKGIDTYNKDGAKLTGLKYSFAPDPGYPASYYIENGLTATHKVLLEYTVNDGDEVFTSEFEVPKEIDGAFIIEGAYRISTNRLGSDYDCRIKMSGTGDHIINFDYDRQYDIARQVLKVKRINPELGIEDKPMSFKLDEIDTLEGEMKEILRLNEKQIKKFMIKLDLDYEPTYISQKLINDCLAFGDDRLRDLIIDKSIESVPSGFMSYIFKSNNQRNYYNSRRQITSYWTKYGRLQEPVKSITMLAHKYFKGSADNKGNSSDVQVPPGVNPINLQSLSNKITVPPTVAVNTTMMDLIDIADY